MMKFTRLAKMGQLLAIVLMSTLLSLPAFAQFKKGAGSGEKRSKVQEVNFEEMTMKGTIRNPEGAFLVQKKNLRFYPLFEVQKDMDARIRGSEPDEILNTSMNQRSQK